MDMQGQLFDLFVGLERSQARLKRKTLTISEGEITYLEGGSGPTLVFLHGFGADKDNWNRLASKLSRNFHIIALDIPGFGESFSPIAGFDIGSQVHRMADFFMKKSIRNFTLVGNSYGGYISAILAKRYPILVKNCVLISPLGVENSPLTPLFKEVVSGGSPLLLPKKLNEFMRLLKNCFYKPPFIPKFALKQMLKRNLAKGSLHQKLFYQTHLLFDGQLTFGFALEKLLIDIELPVHVIWGDRDAVLSSDGLKVLATIENKYITLDCLKNVGHLPQLEIPKHLSHLIVDAIKCAEPNSTSIGETA